MTDLLQMPHDANAERALLGSLLLDPARLKRIGIDVDDFYLERHRWIYDAMRNIDAKIGAMDYVSLCAELRNMGKMRDVGGDAYITQLVSDTPSSLHIDTYVEIVRDKSRRRRIVQAAQRLVKAAYQDDDVKSVVASVLTELATNAGGGGHARHISDVLFDLAEQVQDAIENPRDTFGIPTGMPQFDRITSGLQPSEVLMLSGEPGVGKSLLAMQLVMGAATGCNGIPGTPGVIYQLEMSDIAVVRRAVSARAKVRTRMIRSGRMNEQEFAAVLSAIESLEGLPIYISDHSNMTTLDIRADLSRLKVSGVGWCLIDYMPLLKDNPGLRDVERTALLSDRLHDIAKDLHLHMMVISDMTKAGMTGEVRGQAALAGNRRVSYNADQTVLLTKTQQDNIYLLKWEKYRDDDMGRAAIQLARVPGFPVFAEVAEKRLLP